MSPLVEMRNPEGIRCVGKFVPGYDEVLSPGALAFLAALEERFGRRRRDLLAARAARQAAFDAGERPALPDPRSEIRRGDWSVAPIPSDLLDRRVEITGPVDRKMIINALNSGARVYMADFEDSTSPTWSNLVDGQRNLIDAVAGTIAYIAPNGKQYALAPKVATLMVRPRGLHLEERHCLLAGRPLSASFFDFGLFFFHNARRLVEKGSGPYFYLPKLESHQEARLWNDVFLFAERAIGIATGTIRATVLIETITAAFEMDEILYELREHSAGLNCGRWDYIFSVIKKFRSDPRFVLPDRAQVTMATRFLESYSRLLIQTCHRRRAHAMGGMAAQIPIKGDPAANALAIRKVVEDKEREVRNGHDGTWVAHPALVPVAMEVFDRNMPGPHQWDRLLPDVTITEADLLATPPAMGGITEEGLRANLRIGLEYLTAWLEGSGCVPIRNLMEDAATAEISRAQVWQWIHHPNGILADGRRITVELTRRMLEEELRALKNAGGPAAFDSGATKRAAAILDRLITNDDFADFLTLAAYEEIVTPT